MGSGLKVFSRLDLRRLLLVSQSAAQQLLERYAKKGVLVRIKGGLYALKQNLPSSYQIANKLYAPSYISFETALSYHNLIPETVYSITSATTKTTRTFNAEGQIFKYHRIKKQAFTGYGLVNLAGEKILLAEPEKALADYLYYVFLKKKSLNERLRPKNIKRERLFFYASLFEIPNFLQWVKNVIRTTA